ncbi:MAG: large conductance mechanosensitive channel protein MscL [Firmicutes bacterium]|nr:large conductance mechanosensitive channel protein MscL [Bacillota bacterium]
MKAFFNEFKEFIARGDVMSMAIGIIIGGAFTAIVNSLVNDVITPLLGIILGGMDFTGIAITVGSANLMIGKFIQAVITFLLTAFVVFSIIKTINSIFKKKEEVEEPAAEEKPEIPADIQLLTEIRDMLKERQN